MLCVKCAAELPDGANFCPSCGKKQVVAQPRRQSKRGNGMGSVYRRGDIWVAEITRGYRQADDGGQLKRVNVKKGGFRTKREALEYLPMLQAQQTREKGVTWAQLYNLWFPTHRAGKSTMECYSAANRYFSPVEFWKIQDIEIDDLQECIDDCPKGKRTKENMKALCGLMYKYAVPRGYVPLNLAQYLVVGGEYGSERPGFSREQVEQIRRAAGVVPYADYILCLCYLGFRPSEFLALEVKDYDPAQKTLTGGAKTAAGKNRVVTISPKIQPVIDRLVTGRTEGPLFCDQNGGVFLYGRFRDTAFYPALEAAGIDNPIVDGKHTYTPHSCRHTFATLMKNIQAPEKDKMELIGHASPEMLRYYQSVNLDDLRHITDRL